MKRFDLGYLAATAAVVIVAGCSDPADKVQKSVASEPAKSETALSAATPAPTATREYVIRAKDSSINFVGSKVTGKHDGGFKNFAGTISVADGKIGSAIININMKTIWADNARLTGHLKSADFFDVQKYPASTFTLTSIEPADGQYKVTGNLDLHGVTKSISFLAKVDVADGAVAANADFAINRKDFNINYPGKQNDLIRDNVVLKFAINATPGAVGPEDQIAN